MIKLFKDAVKVTNENIILATPLIIFMWLLSLYVGYSRLSVNSLALMALSFITTIFMTAAFFAGWFYMVKKAIKLSKETFVLDSDKTKAIFNLIKVIPAGIGKYFWPFLGMIFLAIIIIMAVCTIVFKTGMFFIGDLGIDPAAVADVLSTPSGMKAFLDSLTFEQLIKLNNWNLLILCATSITSFIFMLWIPEVVYKTSNPLKAIFSSIKKVFKKIIKTFQLFIFTSILNLVLSFINTFSFANSLLYFVMMLLYFYFLVYLVVLLFLYYDREFVE